MDRRQLQIFQTVAGESSFTRAANKLHMAQPAVSIAIRKLEQSLDVELLNRREKKTTLTDEGQTLLCHAEKILAQFEQAQLEMAELKALAKGRVNLGTSAMMGSYYFPEKIAAFRQQYPHITVSVTGEGTGTARQRLLDGVIDMALVNVANLPNELEVRPLPNKEEVVACGPLNHPLANSKAIDFKTLSEFPLVAYRQGYFLREVIENLAIEQGIQANIGIETDLLRLMLELIRDGQGLGVCLRQVAEQEQGLCIIPFTEPIFLTLGFAWKRNRYVSKANQAFMDFVLTED